MRRRPAPAACRALAAVAAALLLTACSGGGDGAASSGADSAGGSAASLAEAAPAPMESGTVAGGGSAGAQAGGTVLSGRVAPGPALIRTAELTVVVTDVGRAAEAAGAVARAAGGDVGSEERSRAGDDGTDRGGSAVVVLRVPPKAFDATVGRLSDLGEERDRRLGTTDVTDQVVDLDSRIATQRASVERVRALLSRANSLGEVVQVEAELTRRTADLESLQARLASLEAQVGLSTVTVRLLGDDDPEAEPGGALGFSDGLSAGWDALTAVGRAAGVTLGALVPFSPLLLVGGALVWRSRSRRSAAA